LLHIWAGWKDSPLSEFGRKQAQALGRSLSSTHITHYYASPLLRAHTTAQLVHHYQPHPKPLLQLNSHLREQGFGIAEGNPWTMETPKNFTLTELYEQKIFPALYKRNEKFPEGESLDEVALRAEAAIRECVLPHVQCSPGIIPLGSESQSDPNLKRADGESGVHVAITSHGACIAELIRALLKLDPEANQDRRYSGLWNTAWTRVEIRVRDGHHGPIDPVNPPPLEVRVTHVNQKEHVEILRIDPDFHVELDGVSEKAKAFFGGAGIGVLEKRQDDQVDEISKAAL